VNLKDFFFDLPKDRIARFPSDRRDESRLMLVNRKSGKIHHYRFKDIVDLITEDDFLVINNSKVIPARLFGSLHGAVVEVLIVDFDKKSNEAEVYALPARKFHKNSKVDFDKDLFADVVEIGERGKRILKFNKGFIEVFRKGFAPLPPYIKRKFDEAKYLRDFDLERYQTVYSKKSGSIAAPTAGLHFTPELIDKIKMKNQLIEITLDVGEATFQKIETEDVTEHKMGREYVTIKFEERERIKTLKKIKNLIAVGTTCIRSLETLALNNPEEKMFFSDLFIYPGFKFSLVDKLITNFHLPGSSLFILTSAFAGLELIHKAYKIAIEKKYRFFSYGDAMFII